MAKTSPPEAESFYAEALHLLQETDIPFLVGGAYALRTYADIYRDTKDLDVFCKPGDYPAILEALSRAGYSTEITDANWLAKAFSGDHFIDLIFGSANGTSVVDDTWFQYATEINMLDTPVKLAPAEEILCTKLYVQDRFRYDGADVNHIIRKQGPSLDWSRITQHMDRHWEVLLAHLLNFRFVYPSERDTVPGWLMEELLKRAQVELQLPLPRERICRGPLLSRSQYEIDIMDWGYEYGVKQA